MKNRRFDAKYLGIALFIVFCYFSPVPAGAKDEVKVAIRFEPTTIDSIVFGGGAKPIYLAMHQAIMGDENLRTGGRDRQLAESIEILPSQTEIKVKLRIGPRFHTGDPVTAADVKFTYDLMKDPKTASYLFSFARLIKNIRIIDDRTLVFQFQQPVASWQEILAIPITSKNYYEKAGQERFATHPVGCGPFRFVERGIGSHITLEAVPDHHDHKVAFKKLTFLIVKDDITRISMLKSGAVDLITDVAPHELESLEKDKNLRVKITENVPSIYAISTKVSWFPELKDKRVRLAIRHAINRQEMVDKIFLKQGYPLYTFFSKLSYGYDPALSVDYNPEKAKRLLKEAGFDSSKPLVMTYSSIAYNAGFVSQVIQKYLKEVGIEVHLQQLEAGTLITYLKQKDKRAGHLSLAANRWPIDPDTILKLAMKSDGFICSYVDRPHQKEFDTLIETQSAEMDFQKRQELLKEIGRMDFDDPAHAPLFGLNMIYAMGNGIDYTWNEGSLELTKLYSITVKADNSR
jgi:ABC-type transport system substrate-binding protein